MTQITGPFAPRRHAGDPTAQSPDMAPVAAVAVAVAVVTVAAVAVAAVAVAVGVAMAVAETPR